MCVVYLGPVGSNIKGLNFPPKSKSYPPRISLFQHHINRSSLGQVSLKHLPCSLPPSPNQLCPKARETWLGPGHLLRFWFPKCTKGEIPWATKFGQCCMTPSYPDAFTLDSACGRPSKSRWWPTSFSPGNDFPHNTSPPWCSPLCKILRNIKYTHRYYVCIAIEDEFLS